MNEFDALFYSIVGAELKKMRTANNFTLEYVAKSLGVTPKTIQRYELGERKINQEKLKILVDCLGGNYDDFTKEIQRIQLQRTNSLPTSNTDFSSQLTIKDKQDISRKLEETLRELEDEQCGLMFDGEPLDDITRELLANSIKNGLEMSKKIAKQKFTPKKYKKPEV